MRGQPGDPTAAKVTLHGPGRDPPLGARMPASAICCSYCLPWSCCVPQTGWACRRGPLSPRPCPFPCSPGVPFQERSDTFCSNLSASYLRNQLLSKPGWLWLAGPLGPLSLGALKWACLHPSGLAFHGTLLRPRKGSALPSVGPLTGPCPQTLAGPPRVSCTPHL